jgi:hypothetical protein
MDGSKQQQQQHRPHEGQEEEGEEEGEESKGQLVATILYYSSVQCTTAN